MQPAIGRLPGRLWRWPSGPGLRAISLVLFVALWAAIAALIDSRVLPGPYAVGRSLVGHVADGSLPFHISVTLARVAASFFLAMVIGSAIGIAMGRSRRVDAFFDGWLVIGLNIPALVTIILCYVWFGLGEVAAIVAVALNKIPTVVVTIREGARAVDRDLLQVAQAFRVPRRRRFRQVYLPQLYPYLMASARSGLALIWKIVLVVELLGRSNGVGFQLHVFFQFFDITSILAYTLAFVAVILLIEVFILRPLERRLSGWRS
ncbi:MAG: ABC transporter permease subunit [Inquilinus sp.]|nr:ABC transporter permease subunit [Inquilinus sp.]